MRGIGVRILHLLRSPKLTILSIAGLVILLLIGQVVPQRTVLTPNAMEAWRQKSPVLSPLLDRLGLTTMYRSHIVIGLWSVFFLNLTAVMLSRLPTIAKRSRFPPRSFPDPVSSRTMSHRLTRCVPQGTEVEMLARAMRAEGLSVAVKGKRIAAVKNRLSPLGTVAFHLSFYVILAGGLAASLTDFRGRVDLAEGEPFLGTDATYAERPYRARFATPPRIRFGVERIRPSVSGRTPTGLATTIRDSGGAVHILDINQPYKADQTSVVIVNLGIAPLVVIEDSAGRELDGAYVRLDVLGGKEDTFAMLGYIFRCRFYPDLAFQEGHPVSLSDEFRNPHLQIEMSRGGTPKVSALLAEGGSISLGNAILRVPEFRYWVRLFIRRRRGLWIVFAGFALATASLLVRLLLYQRRYAARLDPEPDRTVMHLAGHSEYYPALFREELERVATSLDNRLRARGTATD